MIQTDRSTIELWQKCPRLRYWMREYCGRGLEPVEAQLALRYGAAVHAGVEAIQKGAGLETVVLATKRAWQLATRNELAWNGEGNLEYEDLLEGHLRLWHALAWPKLQGHIASTELEEACYFDLLCNCVPVDKASIKLASRSDWITTDGLVYNLKTVRRDTDKWRLQWEYDNQTLTELLGPEQRLGRPMKGVIIQGLFKEDSPLVWCWRNAKSGEIRSRFRWTCGETHVRDDGKFCPGGKQHTLGKGWQRLRVREIRSLREHFDLLEPELLQEQLVQLGPFNRRAEAPSWAAQHLLREHAIIKRRQTLPLEPSMLDARFPQHQANGNCLWPHKCPAFQLCWGAAAIDPFVSGFRWRTPNHPEEKNALGQKLEDHPATPA